MTRNHQREELSPTGAALLGLLALRPWTTYELATQAKRSLRWFWPRAERKLYAEPKLLVAQGLATASQHTTGRRKSTVYTITRAGRAALRRWLTAEGEALVLESEDLVRLFFADRGAAGQVASTAERLHRQAVEAMSELAEIGATPSGVDPAITGRAHVNALSFALVFDIHRGIAEWGRWASATIERWEQHPDLPGLQPADVFARAVDVARRYGGDPGVDLPPAPGTLLLVVAHPDDETFGCGSVLAAAHERGMHTVVCCATRGEAGEDVSHHTASTAELAEVRERELRAAAALLGVDELQVLGLADSGWDGPAPAGSLVGIEPSVLRSTIEEVLVHHRPDVVVTLDPSGSDGHRDHAAVGRATTEAFQRRVTWGASLYHWCLPRSLMQAWSRHTASSDPASVYLATELGRPDGEITTRIRHPHLLAQRRRAIAAHRTQASPFAGLPTALEEAFLAEDHLVRIVPHWEGGEVETALVGMPAGPAGREATISVQKTVRS